MSACWVVGFSSMMVVVVDWSAEVQHSQLERSVDIFANQTSTADGSNVRFDSQPAKKPAGQDMQVKQSSQPRAFLFFNPSDPPPHGSRMTNHHYHYP